VLAVGAAIAGQLAGHLDRAAPQWVTSGALVAGGVGLLLMTASESWPVYLSGFALVGAGLGLGWAYASVATQVVVEPSKAASASGVTLTMLVAVGGVAVAGAATAIDQLTGDQAVVTISAINDVLRFCAIACLVVGAATPLVGHLRRTETRLQAA
jgi:hypothetical protein